MTFHLSFFFFRPLLLLANSFTIFLMAIGILQARSFFLIAEAWQFVNPLLNPYAFLFHFFSFLFFSTGLWGCCFTKIGSIWEAEQAVARESANMLLHARVHLLHSTGDRGRDRTIL